MRWFHLLAMAWLAAMNAQARDTLNPWAKAVRPAPGVAQAIGNYAAGCLQGGQALPSTATGLLAMRPKRNRHYGHPLIIALLQELGREISAAGHGVVLVGDIAMPRGGPMPTYHVSHQSGLDVDIWFELLPHGSQLTVAERNTKSLLSFVDWPNKTLLPAWGKAQTALIELSAKKPQVERVFVSAVVKQHLCTVARGDRSWLRKVRPWWGHRDHLHVRLACPETSPHCKAQRPLPPGEGCGKALDWWLGAKRSKSSSSKSSSARLPALCKSVLTK
ncbi:MAG: penicillin-insensitive murein endopeptidase [Gammaproteobacteria bacterium]|nr:penicillin-insensitive murein endopeptidase [Gammaproteobacteria bacterium]